MIGQKLNNRYLVTTHLGEGGMGEVYQATDEQTGQQAAVKVLARQLTLHPEALERFKREGETLRQLEHPNIVKFVDAFEYEGQYVIVMEYVSGGNLHDLLQQGPLPIDRARRIALELCDALIRSHHLNIIHRDIKPENVLLLENGTPKLADFGVARLSEGTRMTRSGTQVGTPYYMAPEAWEGKTLDAQADIWSLGVLLFEMLTGQVPFGGDTGAAVMNKVLTGQPPDLKKLRHDTPPHLIKIISRMLTRDKRRRYQTMREVAFNLERGQEGTTSNSKRGPAKGFLHLDWRLWGLIGLVGVLAIVGLVMKQTPTIFSGLLANINSPSSTVIATDTTTLGIGSTTISEKDGMILLYVPAGEFSMGSESGGLDQKPAHKVNLDAFWIDETEVTNEMYTKCIDAGICGPPSNIDHFSNSSYANHPVVYVDWYQANAYCSFADRRLPTEAEWEKAARGTDGRTYPWGEDISCDKANFNSNCVGDTSPIGSYESGKSSYGVYDMAGNAWEWVSSLYKPYPYNSKDGRENMSSSGSRVSRGGAWHDFDSFVRSAYRNGDNPSSANFNYGFRCALSAEATSTSSPPVVVDEALSVSNPNNKSVYLADLTSLTSEVGFFSLGIGKYPFSEGPFINGKTIKANGTEYPYGLFTHAPSKLVYSLGKKYSSFSSEVFIDGYDTCSGTARFIILLDELEIFRSKALTYNFPDAELVNVELNVSGGDTLTLITDSLGTNYCDLTFWGDPYLLP